MPNSNPATAAPPLDAFLRAAAAGRLLWASWTDGQLEICGGATPGSRPSEEIATLFVAALREHYGEAASAIAEREWRLAPRPRRLLPARTVRHAVACAESAFSLLMAQSHLLQIEFSAAMLGWRFRRVAEGLGINPATLSPERRRSLDQLLEGEFRQPLPAHAEAVAAKLKALLTEAAH